MPDNIVNTLPAAVIPMGPMTLFQEELERKAYIDEGYAQGESTRQARTLFERRRFHIARRLTDDQMVQMRDFYNNMRGGKPFWFYHLRETVPPGSWDPTGGATTGRYTVVFDGPLIVAARPGAMKIAGVWKPLHQCEYQLREVVEG